MKTKISRIGKKSLSVIIALMMIVSTMLVGMVSASAVGAYDNGKFKKGDKIYFNFGATGATEVNILNSGYPDKDYYSKSELSALTNKTVECTLTKDLDLSKYTERLYGLNNGGWYHHPNNTSKLPSDGQNMVVVAPDGKSYTWSTYSGSTTNEYTVTYGSNNDSLGTVTATVVSGTKVVENTEVTFTATPTGSNEFKGWYSNPSCTTEISGADQSSTTYTKTVTAPTNVYAKFTSTATPTTTYYLGGRIVQNGTSDAWIPKDNTNYPFIATETPGLYKYVSSQTPAVWSQTRNNLKQYFYVHTGKDNSWYGNSGTTPAELTSANQELSLAPIAYSQDTNEQYLTYINSTDTTGNVIFYLDTNNGMKLYYEVEGGSTTKGAFEIKDKTAVNGSLSFSAEGKTAGTADAGNTVNVKAKPYAGFTCSGITVTYTDTTTKAKVTIPATGSGNSYEFVVPSDLTTTVVKNKEISVAATFTLDKAAYIASQGDGLWIDVAPNENDSTATLIKWNNYSGNNQNTNTNPYTFYVPKNVDLKNAKVYNGFDSAVKLNGVSIPANSCNTETLSLTAGTTYNNGNDDNTYTVKVMQGSTDAMFLYTTNKNGDADSLPTKIDNSLNSKSTVEKSGGSCKTMTDTTDTAKQFSAAMALDSVKGRGNSSWEASYKLFGKYAFNMKLSSATSLFNLPKSKSFCLLANNADDAMMRNAYIYQLAKDIGLHDSPEFEFVDIYDNGEYMGAYLITEKVDVASKDKLIKGNSIDKLNEDAGAKFDETNHERGYASYASDNTVDLDKNAEFVKKYQTTGTYLLEFEIDERYLDEISWFISTEGQHVVVKNPEFATKGEVEFIKNKFNEMEALVYADTIDLEALSKVMDLDSFARMYLIQEFSANLDSAATSYYITYDCSKGLFVASPVWDYDWALGQNNGSKKSKSGQDLYSKDATKWFAKEKAMGDGTQSGSYSLQSKLATDSNFQTVIKKVWNGKNNDGFYAKVQEYYKTDGYLDTWKNQISKSVNMNETRWGFIANNPLRGSAWSYASTNTTNFNGKTGFEGAVAFLKGTSNSGWSKNRVDNLLNNGINAYGNYTQIATPTLTAYAADGTTPLEGEVTAGDTYVLKADTSEIYVDYVLYDGETKVDENSDGVFTISNATAGIHSYTVKTVYNTTNEKTSSAVPVTVSGTVSITDVSISTPKTQVNVDEEFTLTATASPNGLTGVTYTFYKDGTAIPEATNITSNTYKTKFTAEGTAVYKVKATLNDKTVESETVTVTAKTASVKQDVTIYFKTATAPAYAPSVSFDGGNVTAMTKSSELGKDYSGALTFAWYSVEIQNVDTTKTHKLTFTSKRTKLNATWNGTLTTNSYFTADNLMNGTVAVNLTDKGEAERNFFYSATNMVYDSADAKNKTLGFTFVGKARVKMGTVVNVSNGTVTPVSAPTVKSATYIQMVNASMITVSSLQSELYDVNFDGKVDIKDATYIQYALAS